MLTGYQLIIFDFDGTLADSKALAIKSTIRAATDLGYPTPAPEAIGEQFGAELTDMLKNLFPRGDIAALTEKFYHYFAEDDAASNQLFPNVYETLAHFKKSGIKLAIATNRIRVRIEAALRVSSLRSFFSAVKSADDGGPKPNPSMVEAILTELKVPKYSTLIVGDSIADMACAQNLGIDAVAICYGCNTREQLAAHRPLALIDNLQTLIHLVTR